MPIFQCPPGTRCQLYHPIRTRLWRECLSALPYGNCYPANNKRSPSCCSWHCQFWWESCLSSPPREVPVCASPWRGCPKERLHSWTHQVIRNLYGLWQFLVWFSKTTAMLWTMVVLSLVCAHYCTPFIYRLYVRVIWVPILLLIYWRLRQSVWIRHEIVPLISASLGYGESAMIPSCPLDTLTTDTSCSHVGG